MKRILPFLLLFAACQKPEAQPAAERKLSEPPPPPAIALPKQEENDAEGLLKLYAENPIIESPLIPHLLGKEEVVCCGYKEMRPFFEAVAKWQNESLHFVSISELAI